MLIKPGAGVSLRVGLLGLSSLLPHLALTLLSYLLLTLLPHLRLTFWSYLRLTLCSTLNPLGPISLLIDLGLAFLGIFHSLRGPSGLPHLGLTLPLLLHRPGLSSLLPALGLNTILAVNIHPGRILLLIALRLAAWLILSSLRRPSRYPFRRLHLRLGIRLTFHPCVLSSLPLALGLIRIPAINLHGLTILPIALRLTVQLIHSPSLFSFRRLHLRLAVRLTFHLRELSS